MIKENENHGPNEEIRICVKCKFHLVRPVCMSGYKNLCSVSRKTETRINPVTGKRGTFEIEGHGYKYCSEKNSNGRCEDFVPKEGKWWKFW